MRNILVLLPGHRRSNRYRINRHNSVILIAKESGGMIHIHDSGAAVDGCGVRGRPEGEFLVGPVVEVMAGGVAPVLVACYWRI